MLVFHSSHYGARTCAKEVSTCDWFRRDSHVRIAPEQINANHVYGI